MATPEQRFIRELEVFRTEAQVGAQLLYEYLAFNSILSEKKKALSVKRMVQDRKPEWQRQSVQERIVGEVDVLLKTLTNNAQQGAEPRHAKKRRAS
jgi:hypothetical protein